MAKSRNSSTSPSSDPKTPDKTETPETGGETLPGGEDRIDEAVLVEEGETASDTTPETGPKRDEDAETETESEAVTSASEVDAMPEANGPVEDESSEEAHDRAESFAGDQARISDDAEGAEDGGTPPETGTATDSPAMLPAARPEDPAIRKGPGFFTMLLGGVAAGAIGYGLAYYTEFRPFADEGGMTVEALSEQVDAQSARIDELTAMVEAGAGSGERIAAAETGLASTNESLATLRADLDALGEAMAGQEPGTPGVAPEALDELRASSQQGIEALSAQFTDRIEALAGEVQALTDQIANQDLPSAEDLAALEERMAALNAQMEEQDSAIAEAEAAAETETRRISSQAALSQIGASLENGSPFQDALGALQSTSDAEIPAALSDVAPEGVATLAELQSNFPAAARDGLDASIRVTAGDDPISRFGAFLKSQTGARSLDEREGADPDAVLSRAEARLRDGQLADALGELDALPEAGQEAMSGWIDRARARLDALAAQSALSETLNGN